MIVILSLVSVTSPQTEGRIPLTGKPLWPCGNQADYVVAAGSRTGLLKVFIADE
jgi:hypothetical protein